MKDALSYHVLTQKLRTFFLNKNFIEVPTQSRLSILAACENPNSIATFQYENLTYPLPQTGQMWLEYELLKNPEWDGVFCLSTSYRAEKNPIPGRHDLIFPMFEFEIKGTMCDLKNVESELMSWLGFESPIEVDYEDLCQKYGGVHTLEHEHETRMWNEIGPVVSLQNFPLRTSPFWNMKRSEKGTFNKIDVILYGQETIGSAERSSDPVQMEQLFYSISDGQYAEKLFELFGKDRVVRELNEFLSLDFFERSGGGIGMTRLARAYDLSK